MVIVMKIRVAVLLCLMAMVIALGGSAVKASIYPAPYWEMVFEDTNRIFIMNPHYGWIDTYTLNRYEMEYDAYFLWTTESTPSMERLQLRSGMFYNTYPLIRIFYFYNYYRPHEMFFSVCGTYSAGIRGIMPWHESDSFINFYRNGFNIGGYAQEHFFGYERTYGDLISTGAVNLTTAGTFWDVQAERYFDPQTNILSITTEEGNTFSFGITERAATAAGMPPTGNNGNMFFAGMFAFAAVIFIKLVVKLRSELLEGQYGNH